MQYIRSLSASGLCLFLTACGGGSGGSDSSGTIVSNTSDPTISIIGSKNMQVSVGSLFTDPGASAEDNEDGDLTASIEIDSDVNTNFAGNYTITYSVTDSDGNTVSTIRYVIVADSSDNDYSVTWEDDFDLPAQDAEGWSKLRPSSDSIILYVSSTEGSDATGVAYSPSNSLIGSDPFNPAGNIAPYATIKAATDQMRDGYADYVLLKRGDEWAPDDTIVIDQLGADNNRAVLGAYGSITEDRPVVLNQGLHLNATGNLAIVSIHFNADERNPNSANFIPFDQNGENEGYRGIGATMYSNAGNLLIEDCWFEWFSSNVIQSYSFDDDDNIQNIPNIILRRNIFNNNYSTSSHAQGLYSSSTSMLLEENVFDHNGWYEQGDSGTQAYGKATKFNHNTYFSAATNTIFRNNIFLRASSIGNKFTSNPEDTNTIKSWNVLLDNNFYAEGEIGMSIGGNDDNDDGPRWENYIVTNNVLTAMGRSFPTNRGLGWGIGISDWKGGLVQGNYMFSWGDADTYLNTYAIESVGDTTNVEFSDNRIYDIKTSKGVVALNHSSSATTDGTNHNYLVFKNNEIVLPTDHNGHLLSYFINPENVTSAENSFYFGATDDYWFRVSDDYDYTNADITDSRKVTFEQYTAITGDDTSLIETPSYYQLYDRTISSFMADVIGLSGLDETTEIPELVAALKEQRKGNWDSRLTADAINEYFRAGFN